MNCNVEVEPPDPHVNEVVWYLLPGVEECLELSHVDWGARAPLPSVPVWSARPLGAGGCDVPVAAPVHTLTDAERRRWVGLGGCDGHRNNGPEMCGGHTFGWTVELGWAVKTSNGR